MVLKSWLTPESIMVRCSIWLEDGECVHFAGHEFKVLHTLGHSPGHVIYFNEKERFALLGDVFFCGSIGRTDFPLGDDVRFICGHGLGSRIGYERQNNPFLQMVNI